MSIKPNHIRLWEFASMLWLIKITMIQCMIHPYLPGKSDMAKYLSMK